MSFLKSAINQLGRDTGKVISNQIFRDQHSTPYRRVISKERNIIALDNNGPNLVFEKAISFQLGHRPSTLISKISGVYIILKNDINKFISDGYLDTTESSRFFKMLDMFNNKVNDICDVLEIDEISNQKEIDHLGKIIQKTTELFNNALKVSAEGCNHRKSEHLLLADTINEIGFLHYVGYHIIWMGHYARGGKKSIGKIILYNILDIITFLFPFTRIYLFLKGVFTFSSERKRIRKIKSCHLKLADLEGKRGGFFLEITETISMNQNYQYEY